MATNNFARPENASKYFVVLTDQEVNYKECRECMHRHYDWEYNLETLKECENGCENPVFEDGTEYQQPEQFEYDDLKEQIGDYLAEQGGYSKNEYLTSSNRNYPSTELGGFRKYRWFGDMVAVVIVKAIITAGYYEGATLDYLVELACNGIEFDREYFTEEELVPIFNYSSDMGRGMQKIQAKNMVKWSEKMEKQLAEKLENVFDIFASTKLEKVGQFSNGSAVYAQV